MIFKYKCSKWNWISIYVISNIYFSIFKCILYLCIYLIINIFISFFSSFFPRNFFFMDFLINIFISQISHFERLILKIFSKSIRYCILYYIFFYNSLLLYVFKLLTIVQFIDKLDNNKFNFWNQRHAWKF